jgi:hypothetical protein
MAIRKIWVDYLGKGRAVKKILVLCLFLLFHGAAWAGDEFSSVRCGADIPKALLGKSIKKEKVRLIENRHKDIGLENVGNGDTLGDLYVSIWRICGAEYIELLDKRYVIRDVLPFPAHDKDSPSIVGGFCLVNGKESPDEIYAVLTKEAGVDTYPAKAAWTIDQKRKKFVPVSVDGMRCPRDQISTVDQ